MTTGIFEQLFTLNKERKKEQRQNRISKDFFPKVWISTILEVSDWNNFEREFHQGILNEEFWGIRKNHIIEVDGQMGAPTTGTNKDESSSRKEANDYYLVYVRREGYSHERKLLTKWSRTPLDSISIVWLNCLLETAVLRF